MRTNPLLELAALGQSFWYDNIQRSLITSGAFSRMIKDDQLAGVTSNPSIFNNAVSHSPDYDTDLPKLLTSERQMDALALYEALAIDDIRATADVFAPVYEQTGGIDGYVSLEVSPGLARDAEQSIIEARRLFNAVGRPNLMIKIPGTEEGVKAITTLIGEGINVNVTLLFSLQQYTRVIEAYFAGLERLDAAGGDLSKAASVASFFVSRVDSVFDQALEAVGSEKALALVGKMGVANAKAAYRQFQDSFTSDRFKALEQKGARVQRPLWASTSTKNPQYRDVLYVEELIGPDTVNTMPPITVFAFKDHGRAESRLTRDVAQALETMAKIAALGINYDELTEQLQEDGIKAFVSAFESLLTNLEEKRMQYAAKM